MSRKSCAPRAGGGDFIGGHNASSITLAHFVRRHDRPVRARRQRLILNLFPRGHRVDTNRRPFNQHAGQYWHLLVAETYCNSSDLSKEHGKSKRRNGGNDGMPILPLCLYFPDLGESRFKILSQVLKYSPQLLIHSGKPKGISRNCHCARTLSICVHVRCE